MGEKLTNQDQPKDISEYKRVISALIALKHYKKFTREQVYGEILLYLENNPGKDNSQIHGALSHGKGKPSTRASVYGDSDMPKHEVGSGQGRSRKRTSNRKLRPY